MAEALKPCPFCGRAAEIYPHIGNNEYAVVCKTVRCFTEGPHRASRKAAAIAWNRRATLTVDPVKPRKRKERT